MYQIILDYIPLGMIIILQALYIYINGQKFKLLLNNDNILNSEIKNNSIKFDLIFEVMYCNQCEIKRKCGLRKPLSNRMCPHNSVLLGYFINNIKEDV